MDSKTPITAVLCGAGNRGREVYGTYAQKNPDKLKFIAVADPDTERRSLFQQEHHIPDERAFSSWKDLLNPSVGKIAELAFICTQDQMHYEPAMQAMDLSYDLLLEKPISPNLNECQEITSKASATKRLVQISHVLRFTPFWKKIKEIVDSGKIGDIIDYDHSENVSYWHFGHSYVRGPYKNKETSSPLILAKSCHDLDLMYWIIGKRPISVQSAGSLTHYRKENAPPDSPEYCTDGCPHEDACPWYAPRLYINCEPIIRVGRFSPKFFDRLLSKMILKRHPLLKLFALFNSDLKSVMDWRKWPTSVITTDFSPEGKYAGLHHSDYDRCIFKCENNVVDHQMSTFRFPDGVTGTLRVHGLSDLEGREIRIFGTKGVIRGVFRENEKKIIVRDFRFSNEEIAFHQSLDLSGHGGGDEGLMNAFLDYLHTDSSISENTIDVSEAMESHYMAFAAEEARISHETLKIAEFRKNHK